MRNLKRALSLALASIMVLGMMVVGAGAVSYDELTDKDKIVNQEAVQMLVELGVIDGKEDGTYDPEGIITRAEMSKLICVVLNGGNDPQLGATPVVTYTDTVGNWAAPFIEYCTTLGIVAGDGKGNFNPSNTVTGSEAAKMLLVALGYNAEFETMIGANWEVATNVLANKNSLYKGLSINPSQGLTRDSAAQMVFNALNAKMVEYDYSVIPSNGSVSAIAKAKNYEDGRTLLSSEFNAVKVEGIVIANEVSNLNSTSAALESGKTKVQVTNAEDQNEFTGSPIFTTTTGMDQLGRSVILYVKKNNNATKAQVLGNVITSDDNKVVVDYTKDSIKDVADDNNMDIVSGTQVAVNYGALEKLSSYTDPKLAGIEKVLIDNDNDGEVDVVLMNTYVFGKVTTYTSSGDGSIAVTTKDLKGTSDALTADDKDDVVGFDDVAKNDYVMAIEIGGKLYVEKAETITGALEAYKGAAPTTKLTVDGTDYNVSNVPGYTGGADNIVAASTYGKDNLDNEATFYLDKGGYIVSVGDVSENAYNFALVMAKGTSIDERVKVALPDGTTTSYNLNTNGNGLKLNEIDVGTVYGYTLNSNKEIRLTNAMTKAEYSGTDATFTKGKTSVKATGATTTYATKNTVFFYTKGLESGVISDVDVYTGYEKAPTVESTSHAGLTYYTNTNGARTVAVVFTGDDLTSTNVNDNLYISSVGSSTSNYTNATAFINGKSEPTAIKMDSNYGTGAYTYTINSDGYYVLKNVPGANLKTDVLVKAANNNTFVLTDGTELSITAKTLLVDDSKYLDDPVAELGAGPDENDKIAYVVYNLDNNVADEALLVVVKNEKAGGGTPVSKEVVVDFDGAEVNAFNPANESVSAVVNKVVDTLESKGYTDISVDTLNNAALGAKITDISAKTGSVKVTIPVYNAARLDVNGKTVDYIHSGESKTVSASVAGLSLVVEKTAPSATAVTSYSLTASDAVDGVVNLVDAAKVTLDGSTTAKLKSDNTSISSNDYVIAGTEVTVTGTAGKNKAITATVGSDVTTGDLTATNAAPTMNFKVTADVTFNQISTLTLTAGDGVKEIKYQDGGASANMQTLKAGESVNVKPGTIGTITFEADAGTKYTVDGGENFIAIATTDISAMNDNVIVEAGYVDVTIPGATSNLFGNTTEAWTVNGETKAAGSHVVKVGSEVVLTWTVDSTGFTSASGTVNAVADDGTAAVAEAFAEGAAPTITNGGDTINFTASTLYQSGVITFTWTIGTTALTPSVAVTNS